MLRSRLLCRRRRAHRVTVTLRSCVLVEFSKSAVRNRFCPLDPRPNTGDSRANHNSSSQTPFVDHISYLPTRPQRLGVKLGLPHTHSVSFQHVSDKFMRIKIVCNHGVTIHEEHFQDALCSRLRCIKMTQLLAFKGIPGHRPYVHDLLSFHFLFQDTYIA